jgi:ABC-2 type transport system permease protein
MFVGIGWNLIELRIKNLLRRMVATQLKKSVLLLSHGLNRMFIIAAELLLLYVFVHFFLILQFRGVCWRCL